MALCEVTVSLIASKPRTRHMFPKPRVAEFFAGSGLVRDGLGLWFKTVWANDICPKKAAIYAANFGDQELSLKPIEQVSGSEVPPVDLAWASFPCQDLSLAGKLAGMKRGSRSGLFWEWLRVLDEMPAHAKPRVLAIENVVGFLIAENGAHFRDAYMALRERNYRVGALVIDTIHFLPQSRPRAFVVAAQEDSDVEGLTSEEPDTLWHPKSVLTAYKLVGDPNWAWWTLPKPPSRTQTFAEICEFDVPADPPEITERMLGMLSPVNRAKLDKAIASGKQLAGTGYKRTRRDAKGKKRQRLEIRFDGIAGCLRTPEGGSSRQVVLIVDKGKVKTRLMTVRETARLMGAPEEFKIPGSYNDGYKATGDAVGVPVTKCLAENLLSPLCIRNYEALAVAAE